MLYDVPQTDSTSEAAMAALVARVRTAAPKPEAFPAEEDAGIALHAAHWVARIGSALGDRATLPLLQWDPSLDGVCIALTSRSFLNSRGRNRQAGADDGIDANAIEALAYLARCKPGVPEGKRENPRYIDSAGNSIVVDRVRIISSGTADGWAGNSGRCGGCP